MTSESFLSDIPRELANRAHAGTSFSPEQRGRSEINQYATTLAADWANLVTGANTPEKLVLLESEFARYREGYRRRFLAYLAGLSRCLSTMITRASKFPTRRNQKHNAAVDRRSDELNEYRKRAIQAIWKALHPEMRPIMAGDADAIERLEAKIAEAEKLQSEMRAVNSAIRRNVKKGEDAQVAAMLAACPKLGEARARLLLKPDFVGRVGFADYELSNNNANIRRMKERVEGLRRTKGATPTTLRGENGVLYEDCPADNRVRLFFSQIPDLATRTRLKSQGFRWTPSLRCWQAYRNPVSLERAKAFVKTVATPSN